MPPVSAEQIRAALSGEPGLLALADALRERFNAKLIWLKTGTLELGVPIVGAVTVRF